MEYCISAFLESKKEERFKYYITDAGYLLANGYYQAHGSEAPLPERYAEQYKKKPEKKEETADEIISRIYNGLKGL